MSPGSKTLKMYALTGIVKTVKPRARKVTLHSTHIRGRKEPSEREYTIEKAAVFSRAREGDFVHATLLTDHADVWLLDEAKFVHKSESPGRGQPAAKESMAAAGGGPAHKKILLHDGSAGAAHRNQRSGAAR